MIAVDELQFIDALRAIATHPSARGLRDDAAVLPFGRQRLILTHDTMVEGVHFLSRANPADIGWKLVAVNLSDLAAKGARPLGLLLSCAFDRPDAWKTAFLGGLKEALDRFGVPLLGGDTVRSDTVVIGATAIGEGKGHLVPDRGGALPGHALFVTGTIGDGWGGLQVARELVEPCPALLAAYARPVPLLNEGRAIAHLVGAVLDISDGLLLDARRIALASGVRIDVDLSAIPLSDAFVATFGDDAPARLNAATGGDDYQLLFTASPETVMPVPATRVGTCRAGSGIGLNDAGEPVEMPDDPGFVHG